MMQTNISSANYYNDPAAKKLVEHLENQQEQLQLEDSVVYYQFPLFKEIDKDVDYPSVMLISPVHGIVIFHCDDRSHREITNDEVYSMTEDISQLFSFVFAKLIKEKSLRQGRNQLKFDISTAIFLPRFDRVNEELDLDDETHLITDYADVANLLTEIKSEPIDGSILKEISAILEGSKGIIKPKDRHLSDDFKGSKGYILAGLEKEIATFDEKQKIAALTQIDGPQRIRGLAGSGKTVILAMKAALIAIRNPHAKILYTFYTKSLYDHVKRLVTRFYRMHEDRDPDWDNIHIRHAWGGVRTPGVYYDACRTNNVAPIPFKEANSKSKNDEFDYVCKDLLRRTNAKLEKKYDYVLIDEGQDFKPSFYWLCRNIVKNDCLVWAYDELQNILEVEIQRTTELFKNEFGDEGIDLTELRQRYPKLDNDIVLPKSYRNAKEILVVSHAIGFGIYNDRIIQMLENKDHWTDVGYEVVEGECIVGERTVIHRPRSNSPLTISDSQSIKDLIKGFKGKDMDSEIDWVSNSIKLDIEDKLLPEDIMVICVDNKNARTYFNKLSRKLYDLGIYSNNVLNNFNDDFIVEGSVTLTTVYRAKGNEAAMVYVIGTDVFGEQKDYIVERNKIFTAFTRAKGWLRVTGTGDKTGVLFQEMKKAIEKLPNLEFVYPDPKDLKMFQRDLAMDAAKKAEVRRKLFDEIMAQAEHTGMTVEEILQLLSLEGEQK